MCVVCVACVYVRVGSVRVRVCVYEGGQCVCLLCVLCVGV